VVDESWIIESVMRGERQHPDSFPFVDRPFATYAGRADEWWMTDWKERTERLIREEEEEVLLATPPSSPDKSSAVLPILCNSADIKCIEASKDEEVPAEETLPNETNTAVSETESPTGIVLPITSKRRRPRGPRASHRSDHANPHDRNFPGTSLSPPPFKRSLQDAVASHTSTAAMRSEQLPAVLKPKPPLVTDEIIKQLGLEIGGKWRKLATALHPIESEWAVLNKNADRGSACVRRMLKAWRGAQQEDATPRNLSLMLIDAGLFDEKVSKILKPDRETPESSIQAGWLGSTSNENSNEPQGFILLDEAGASDDDVVIIDENQRREESFDSSQKEGSQTLPDAVVPNSPPEETQPLSTKNTSTTSAAKEATVITRE
jgi:hypothetical protein